MSKYSSMLVIYYIVISLSITRILNISIKIFKRFRNVRKSIETSGDISVL